MVNWLCANFPNALLQKQSLKAETYTQIRHNFILACSAKVTFLEPSQLNLIMDTLTASTRVRVGLRLAVVDLNFLQPI